MKRFTLVLLALLLAAALWFGTLSEGAALRPVLSPDGVEAGVKAVAAAEDEDDEDWDDEDWDEDEEEEWEEVEDWEEDEDDEDWDDEDWDDEDEEDEEDEEEEWKEDEDDEDEDDEDEEEEWEEDEDDEDEDEDEDDEDEDEVKATAKPTTKATAKATAKPTAKATAKPTAKATAKPTAKATAKPTAKATAKPTSKATAKPTAKATAKPTEKATAKPTEKATAKPTAKPVSLKAQKKAGKLVLSVEDHVYTGKALKPAVKVKLNGKKLTLNKDYSVSYKDNKAVGTATVTVKGKGKYTDSVKTTFRINPEKVEGLKLKAGKKSMTVKWTSMKYVTGYQIEYSLKKTFENSKTVTVTTANTAKLKISKLKSGKTYFVRIRAYKAIKKEKYWSAWSSAKKVTVE